MATVLKNASIKNKIEVGSFTKHDDGAHSYCENTISASFCISGWILAFLRKAGRFRYRLFSVGNYREEI